MTKEQLITTIKSIFEECKKDDDASVQFVQLVLGVILAFSDFSKDSKEINSLVYDLSRQLQLEPWWMK